MVVGKTKKQGVTFAGFRRMILCGLDTSGSWKTVKKTKRASPERADWRYVIDNP
jgi:hypothetical protein